MTGRPGVVACGCNNHSTAATVRISAKNRNKKKNKPEVRSENKAQLVAKREKNGQEKVNAGKIIKEETKTAAKNKEQKTLKNPDEPYQDIFASPETGKISLFKSKDCKLSVFSEINYLGMRLVVGILTLALFPAS